MSETGQDRRAARLAFVAICAASLVVQAHAQQPPDAGSLQRQLEPPHTPALPKPVAPEAGNAQRDRAVAQGPRIQITQFVFQGNKRYSDAELTAVVAGYVNRPVSLAEIEDAANLVAQYYRAQGWLARVLVPPQQVNQGTVTLKIIEAVMGDTRFTADTPQDSLAVPPQELQRWIESSQPKGQDLNLPRLERGLLLTKDLPGVDVKGSETTGKDEGVTDVLLRANNTGAVQGELTLDNYGTPDTGRARVAGRLSWNNWVGIGDQYTLLAQATDTMRFGYLAASVPVGHQGLRVGINASTSRYRIDTPQFEALGLKGRSSSVDANFVYPLLRSAATNVYLSGDLESKHFVNESAVGTTSDYEIRDASLKLEANFYDSLGAGAVNTASVTAVDGHADLDGFAAYEATDRAGANTQGHFNVLRFRLSRAQALTQDFSLIATLSGQWASKNVDSSERLYGGGPYAVRAYAQGSAGAARAGILNLDARWRLPLCDCEASLFYDRMEARINVSNSYPGGLARNGFVLEGVGLGLSANLDTHWHFVFTLANRLGDDPTTAANKQGRRTQGWASVSYSF